MNLSARAKRAASRAEADDLFEEIVESARHEVGVENGELSPGERVILRVMAEMFHYQVAHEAKSAVSVKRPAALGAALAVGVLAGVVEGAKYFL